MDMFSKTEILLMIGVVSALLIVITILTILDIKDYLKNKDKDLEEYDFEEDIEMEKQDKNEEVELIEVLEVNDNDEIMISDIDTSDEVMSIEPVIEEVEEVNTTMPVEESKEISPSNVKLDVQEELNKVLETIPDDERMVTSFEEEQERTAIISLDELLSKSDSLYSNNEIKQYDDGNEPISIDEVMSMYNKEEKNVPDIMQDIVEEKKIYSNKENVPFISSIYGIETNNSLEFENTATYEKLSRAKKNEFMAKLHEISENK